ncbi:unnamed protein product [Dovyalis caffra]|uniref:Uncharacterized protein n=1 Tax=Dovyalis caffra TaxID=77055 RepID=A0AAV1RJC6_9ROSI|nr:unnamed protein product [Dovyalis caffra]
MISTIEIQVDELIEQMGTTITELPKPLNMAEDYSKAVIAEETLPGQTDLNMNTDYCSHEQEPSNTQADGEKANECVEEDIELCNKFSAFMNMDEETLFDTTEQHHCRGSFSNGYQIQKHLLKRKGRRGRDVDSQGILDFNDCCAMIGVDDAGYRDSRLKQSDGMLMDDITMIGDATEMYFNELFSSFSTILHDYLFIGIEKKISAEDNASLLGLPTEEEIWEAVRALDPVSVPRGDGFTGHFLQGGWDIYQNKCNCDSKGFL